MACPLHQRTMVEYKSFKLGPNFERYYRKVYLSSVLCDEYRDIFTERVNILVEL
jgi:hypothetical protein